MSRNNNHLMNQCQNIAALYNYAYIINAFKISTISVLDEWAKCKGQAFMNTSYNQIRPDTHA